MLFHYKFNFKKQLIFFLICSIKYKKYKILFFKTLAALLYFKWNFNFPRIYIFFFFFFLIIIFYLYYKFIFNKINLYYIFFSFFFFFFFFYIFYLYFFYFFLFFFI